MANQKVLVTMCDCRLAGILDVLRQLCIRSHQVILHPGFTDVYVSLGQVRITKLRKGDAVIGSYVQHPRVYNTRAAKSYKRGA